MAASLKKLGALTSKSMTGITTSSEKDMKTGVTTQVASGDYDLVFANGKAKLAFKVVSGKVAAAHVSGVEFTKK